MAILQDDHANSGTLEQHGLLNLAKAILCVAPSICITITDNNRFPENIVINQQLVMAAFVQCLKNWHCPILYCVCHIEECKSYFILVTLLGTWLTSKNDAKLGVPLEHFPTHLAQELFKLRHLRLR